MRKTTIVVLALLALTVAQPAAGHVEPKPDKITAGRVAKVTFEVPAEEKVPAVKFSVQLPVSLGDVALQPTSGWKSALRGRIASWSGGQIAPGKAAEFALSARWPATPGKTLVFPAVEKYASGKVVYWIGPESSATPAARVTLLGAKTPPSTATKIAISPQKDDDRNIAVWVVVAVAAFGAVVVGAWLLRKRRA
jgi:uncharacterized protein YcnI